MLLVAACTNALESQLPDSSAIDLSPKGKTAIKSRQGNPSAKASRQGSYELFAGTAVDGGSVGDLSSGAEGVEQTGDKFSINVDGADIGEVTKLVLGDTLGMNYILDQRVQGTMTIATVRPMTAKQVLSAFEQALRLSGATLIRQGETYKVVPLQEVLEGEMGTAEQAERGASATPGYGVTIIPLRFISPNNMLELLDSFVARSGSVRASNIGNMVLLRGSGQERQQLVDVVLSFDVDWMKQQTASIAILANSKPAEMVQKLQSIFATDSSFSGGNALKVIPLERLNGVVLIANSQKKVKRALTWVARLDQESDEETQYYVYNVQNGSAVSLAKILNATFLEKSGEETVASQVDPNQDTATASTDSSSSDGSSDEDNIDEEGDGTDQAADGKSDRQDAALDTAATTASTDTPKTDLSAGIRITPNPETNTIIIRAPPKVYAKILSTLKQIDKQAVQVLVNATIAEVSLNDELSYGVQAYLKEKDINVGYSNATGLAIKPNIGGFNFLFGGAVSPNIVLEALSSVTRVKVVSSPSVVVLENENAVIKVGESVAVKVKSITSGDANDANDTANQFEYRDTGVILKVKPRISANGLVTMVISQELSSVVGGTTDNPTFAQRVVASTVSVQSSQTVALGGMISGQESRGKKSVPVLNKVPILGDLVGKTENTAKRTELLIFLTPQVIQDGEDAAQVSEELREKMRTLGFN